MYGVTLTEFVPEQQSVLSIYLSHARKIVWDWSVGRVLFVVLT